MKTIKPNYFDKFCCLKGNCKYSCCSAGWNIEVDATTLQKYSNSKDKYLQDTTNYIDFQNKNRCFKLETNRCVFLDSEGLCELVKKHGNSYLCNVCRDYPRFYNFFSNRTEVGLSLDCEAVSTIVLSENESFCLVSDDDNIKISRRDEADYNLRNDIFKILTNKNKDFIKKLAEIKNLMSIENLTFENLTCVMDEFEWLNFDGKKLVETLKQTDIKKDFFLNEKILENLMCYFVYRYLLNNNFGQTKKSKMKFCMFMVCLIDTMALLEVKDNTKIKQIVFVVQKICRQIEYSKNNVNFALNYFENKII